MKEVGGIDYGRSRLMILGLIKLMRPQQWVKNVFVFAPLVFSSKFTDIIAVQQSFMAFLIFCVASSSVYAVNDIMDRERDRQHPLKSTSRPIANGDVSVAAAVFLAACLFVIVVVAWIFVYDFVHVIIAYMALNVAYSVWLKHQPVVDIFTIALGFVMRVYAGAEAIVVPVSSWMFVTTLCLALYLAATKRQQELRKRGDQAREVLRRYTPELVNRYAEMSAIGALVFYSLFVMSSQPNLVITVPVVLFGLFRYWYIVDSLEGGESPTDALLYDIPLLMTVLCWAFVCIATLWPEGAS